MGFEKFNDPERTQRLVDRGMRVNGNKDFTTFSMVSRRGVSPGRGMPVRGGGVSRFGRGLAKALYIWLYVWLLSFFSTASRWVGVTIHRLPLYGLVYGLRFHPLFSRSLECTAAAPFVLPEGIRRTLHHRFRRVSLKNTGCIGLDCLASP